MIKSLRQARITDGLPRVVAKQAWVIALSEALGLALGKALDYTDESQIYTQLDTTPEAVLDVLAVDWKIDWYDTSLDVEQKRSIVKTALMVRRLMGTLAAVKLQAHALYPETVVEEWFQYGGRPGCFRVKLPLPKEGITAAQYRRLKNGILAAKNERSHLDVIDIQYDCDTKVLTGGCSAISQVVEVWPELVEALEITVERLAGGAVSIGQKTEVWPDLVGTLEMTVARPTGGTVLAAEALEVWPNLVAVLKIDTAEYNGGTTCTGQAMEVWPELAVEVTATAKLDEGGAAAASQVVEIYPEGEDNPWILKM